MQVCFVMKLPQNTIHHLFDYKVIIKSVPREKRERGIRCMPNKFYKLCLI